MNRMSTSGIGRLGVSVANRAIVFGAATVADLLRTAELADASGVFDSVWVGDSLLAKPRLDSIALLSAIAVRTQRVRLGPACFASFPLRHPIVLAYQWASLDVLSEGRTIMVACIGGGTEKGSGHFHDEYAAMGIEPRERAARMEEGIAILRKLWTGDHVDHEGAYYRFREVTLAPKPVQRPCPPIWITANPHSVGVRSDKVVERLFRRVATLGDGWMTAGVTPSEFADDLVQLRRYLLEAGKDDRYFPTSIHYMINVNPSERQALEEHSRFLHAYYDFDWPQEKLDTRTAYGPPAKCAEAILAYFEAGLSTISLRFTSWDQVGQVRRFIDEVVPRLP